MLSVFFVEEKDSDYVILFKKKIVCFCKGSTHGDETPPLSQFRTEIIYQTCSSTFRYVKALVV